MFNKMKKSKEDKRINMLEDEIIVQENDVEYDEIEVPSKSMRRKQKKVEKKALRKTRKTQNPLEKEVKQNIEYNFVWANNEEFEKKLEKSQKKRLSPFKRKKKIDVDEYEKSSNVQVTNIVVTKNKRPIASNPKDVKNDIEENPLPVLPEENMKKELDEYFLKNDKNLFVESNKKKSKPKKNGKKFRNYYKYKGKKFQTPRDFVEFLDKNPNRIDRIAKTVIDDELFFEWLGKNSHQFIESVKDFRTFKKKIEK